MTFHRTLCFLAMASSMPLCGPATATPTSASCHSQSVALRLFDSRALVTVAINGQKTDMILDTGANETVLFEDAPSGLGLQPSVNLAAVQTTSYGQPLSVHFVHADTVDFAGSVSHSVDLAVLATKQGSIGPRGFFADARIQEAEFDLRRKVLHLACPPFSPPRWTRQRGVTTVPLEAVSRVFGAGFVNGMAMRVLFDTGSPTSSMTLAAAQRAGIRIDGLSNLTAAGLAPGSALRAWKGKVDNFRLGDGDVAEIPLLIVDKPHASADMIMGFDFFVRHRVWIDRSKHVLRFSDLASEVP